MEKFINRSIIVVVAVLILFVFNKIRIASTSHHGNLEQIHQSQVSEKITDLLTQYLIENFEYPENINELFADKNQYLKMQNETWLDPFSQDSSHFVYLPIYDQSSKKRMAFIILSAGTDGKIDLKINDEDSLFLDNLDEYLAAYNKLNMDSDNEQIDFRVGFSMFDQVGGKKDLVVAHGMARKTLNKYAQPLDETSINKQTGNIYRIDVAKLNPIEKLMDTIKSNYLNYGLVMLMHDKFSDDAQEIVFQFHSYDSLNAKVYLNNGLVVQ